MTDLEARAMEIAEKLAECGNPHCDRGVCVGEMCWTCGGKGRTEPDLDGIAAALVAFAREHAARALQAQFVALKGEPYGTQWHYEQQTSISAALAAAEQE